eukprot:TRINITY_DN17602_c0_g2_i1.p1 TRINITY_DN17602_c0_g2~~TRINITY_DN17602_c0_g2_i1.p1  ORF type:complete len:497 (+),score=123.60 TRINITY_DN17602_c0_g2_i1:52-1542(+)
MALEGGTAATGSRRASNTGPGSRRASNAGKIGAGESTQNNEESGMDPDELMKVFKKIDLDNNGTLDLNEISIAAKELGVKCSQNALKKVFKMIDIDGSGVIDFEEFSVFFSKVGDPEKIKDVLSAASAAFLDYRTRVTEDPSFAKHFPLPPAVKPALKYYRHNNSNVEAIRWISATEFMSATGDGRLLIWDAANPTDKPIKESNLANGSVYCMDFQRGVRGVLVGFGSKKDNLWLWDATADEPVCKYEGQDSAVYSCGLSERGVVSGNKNGRIVLNDLNSTMCVNSGVVHEGLVTSCQFHEDSRKILTCSRDGSILVMDAGTAALSDAIVCKIEDAAAGYTVCHALWCSEYEILSAGDDYGIKRWDIRMSTAPPVESYMGHTSCVTALALSEDKRFFASGDAKGSVRIWGLDPQWLRSRSTSATSCEESDSHPAYSAYTEGQMDDFCRASLSLSGHSMSLCTLAWQDPVNGRAQVVSGAQDEMQCLYNFETASIKV